MDVTYICAWGSSWAVIKRSNRYGSHLDLIKSAYGAPAGQLPNKAVGVDGSHQNLRMRLLLDSSLREAVGMEVTYIRLCSGAPAGQFQPVLEVTHIFYGAPAGHLPSEKQVCRAAGIARRTTRIQLASNGWYDIHFCFSRAASRREVRPTGLLCVRKIGRRTARIHVTPKG